MPISAELNLVKLDLRQRQEDPKAISKKRLLAKLVSTAKPTRCCDHLWHRQGGKRIQKGVLSSQSPFPL